MGRFEKEIDLLLHGSIQEYLRYCRLIGPEGDNTNLEEYTNNLIQSFIEEQVQYLLNSQRVINHWIITASEILHNVIIDEKLPISEMPPVQM